jgi:cation diffusion facilitator family transporter
MKIWFPHIPRVEARAAMLSLAVGSVLVGIKFLAYFVTGSNAIFSDALEGIVNVTAAGLAFYSLHVAHSPADEDHPYGHGKVEFISAGFEGGMILIAAAVIVFQTIYTTIQSTLGGRPQVTAADVGLVLILIALALNGLVGLQLIRIGKREKSLILEADGRHLISDAVTSLAAAAAMLLIRFFGWQWADPVAAVVMAGYIAVMGVRLVKRSLAGLMDAQDVEDERLLREILDAHVGAVGKEPRICSYHKLRHRHSGRYHWVDFHIMVPAGLTVQQGHAMASAIEFEIEQALETGNATAHVEPCGEETCSTCEGERKAEAVRG